MELEVEFLPLFLVMVVAVLSPLITSQLKVIKIPAVAVEIIAGIVVGQYGMNLLHETPYLNFLGLIGFIFLMFLSGLEVDVHKIIASLPRRKLTVARTTGNPLLMGIIIYLGTLVLALLGAWFISHIISVRNIWFFAVIISTTSLGVIIPVLKDRGEISTKFGQMLVLAAAVADILGILLFTLTTSLLKQGFQFEIVLLLFLFLAFYLSYRIGRRLVRVKLFKRTLFELSHSASQLKVRGAILLLSIFLIITQLMEIEVILGAFMAGVLLSIFTSKERSSLIMKLDAIGYGFFIPIFFIQVGANIDLSVVQDIGGSYLFLATLLLTFFIIKVVPSLVWVRQFGFKQALAGGFLLSSQLSLIIAAAQIGMQMGVISSATNTSFVILAVVTCIFSPIIYNQLSEKSMIPKDKTIIVGGSFASELLARNLKMHDKEVIIIETDLRKVELLRDEGLQVIHGNGADVKLYEYMELQPENYVIILTDSDEKNLAVAQILKNDLQHENIISYAADYKNVEIFKVLEIEALYLSQTLATSLENLIFRPATYHTLFESFESYSVEEIPVLNKKLDTMMVREISFHKDGFLMLIKRNKEMIVPHGDDFLMLGDVAIVFGNDTALSDFRNKFIGTSQVRLLTENQKNYPHLKFS